MMAIFKARGSINLNVQRGEWEYREKMDRKKPPKTTTTTHTKKTPWDNTDKFRYTVSPADTSWGKGPYRSRNEMTVNNHLTMVGFRFQTPTFHGFGDLESKPAVRMRTYPSGIQ